MPRLLPVLPVVLILLGSLACAGGPSTPALPLEGCDAVAVPSMPMPLASSLAATPAWAADYGGTGVTVTVGAARVPQLPDAASLLDGLGPLAVADGGPLLCEAALPTGGTRQSALRLADGTTIQAQDGTFPPTRHVWSVPGFRATTGSPVAMAGASIDSTCTPDPFWVLVTALPIPRCKEHASGRIDTNTAWNGELRATGASGMVCRAAPLADALTAAAGALAGFDGAVRSICEVSTVDPAASEGGWDRMHADAARADLATAAAWTGWADPAVVAGVARLQRVEASWRKLAGR